MESVLLVKEAGLPGSYLVDLKRLEDDRGFFARAFCEKEFFDQGLVSRFMQCNISWNLKVATLRGMHYQLAPHAEVKLIRCIRGRIYDVIVDLREDSPTRHEWRGFELTAENRTMIYVPEGFGHGYQALTDDTETFYMTSEFYTPSDERGFRWNDPLFKIEWPLADPILSAKDRSHEDYQP